MPRMRMKSARGVSPAGGGPLARSEKESTQMRRTAVPRNSSKKHETFVM